MRIFVTNIILCSGSGTRLWPISRTLMPKRFVKLFKNKSLFQLTEKCNISFFNKQFIVSNAEEYFLALDQLDEMKAQKRNHYLLEPVAKNTAPAIALACMALERAKELTSQDHLTTFGITPKFAEIGFGYIESNKEKVVESDIDWSNVGCFDTLHEELPKDANGNIESNNHISIDSKNNLVLCENRKIKTINIEDLIIVDKRDTLLISKKGSAQKIKHVVVELKNRNTELHNIHLTTHRPWGSYTILEDTPEYKIKRIVVQAGKRLSLQKHFHQNKHWIVLSGTATVTVREHTSLIRPNESTYIKAGEIHSLANAGKIPLIIVEVQVGEYTGEDDIVRIEDDFNRGEK